MIDVEQRVPTDRRRALVLRVRLCNMHNSMVTLWDNLVKSKADGVIAKPDPGKQ